MNCGSVDSFHISIRCGFSPKARQIRETADWDMPCDLAIDRVDQCVSPPGGACSSVAVITASTCSSRLQRPPLVVGQVEGNQFRAPKAPPATAINI
jgi:hypothetical protein